MTSQALRPQTTIREYTILRVLGKGSYGITYLATDTKNNRPVAIKEYFPMRFAERDSDGIVSAAQPSSDDIEDFDSGLSRFLEEAATLAGFRDENIVEVFDWFEYNGTAYVVMRYEEGGTLSRYLAVHKELIKEGDFLAIFIPLLKGLRTVHAKWFLHRDIKPENIYIRKNGQPLLIDFGTARHAGSARHGGMTAYLTPGFAPPEQYDRSGDHGPWTDIYALGATMYYCVTRITPSDGGDRYVSLLRSGNDPVTPATQAAPSMYDKGLLEVIDWMMEPDHGKRPQSVDEVLFRLSALPAYDEAVKGGGAQAGSGTRLRVSGTEDIGADESAGESQPTVVSSSVDGDATEKVSEPTPAPTPAPTPKPKAPPKPKSTPKPKATPKPAPPTVPVDSAPAAEGREGGAVQVTNETVRKEPSSVKPPASPTTTADTGRATGTTPPWQRKPFLMYGAIAVVVVSLVGVGLLLWRTDEPSPPPEQAQLPEEEELAESDVERQQREQQEQAEAEREQQEQAEAEREQQEQVEAERARVNELLDQCDSRLAAGPATGASGEQALACYREVLDQQPDNEAALNGVARIENSILDEVQNALNSGAYSQAGTYVNRLKALELAGGRIADLEEKVKRGTPGETVEDPLKDGGSAPAMVVIPAGNFAMGCDGATQCADEQQPSHNVRISQPFLVGQFEVTFDDYERFAAATGRPVPDDLGWGRGQRPVINVTWNDAQAYAEWLRDQTGQPYRLLSEAEWEYIARADSDNTYFYGDDESDLCTYGNHADADSQLSWGNGRCGDGFSDRTAPAGTYSSSDWGVSDVIGNVWEWVADCWHDNYEQAPGGAAAWRDGDGGDCERRVIRGGSWYDGPGLLLPEIRNWAMTDERNDVVGFRIAADVN